jgi:hypothetical protein
MFGLKIPHENAYLKAALLLTGDNNYGNNNVGNSNFGSNNIGMVPLLHHKTNSAVEVRLTSLDDCT